MADTVFENALSTLLTTQCKRILMSTLIVIKKGVSENRKVNTGKLYATKNCLKQLVTLLEMANNTILNLTISILGNVCVDKTCARDVVKQYNVLPQLSRLLKEYKKDNIQGRICRLIGNLCQHEDRLANDIVKHELRLEIVKNVIENLKLVSQDQSHLEESMRVSKGTIMMAIRALRELLNTNTADVIIGNCGISKAIGVLLIKYTPLWSANRENQDILEATLNLLHLCSKYESNNIILELKNTEAGDAMIHISELVLLSPLLTRKIIENLLKGCQHQTDLPINEIFRCLIKKLEDAESFESGMEDVLYGEYLHCLCFLVKHETTREVLNVGLITVLMNIIKSYKNPTQTALKNCKTVIASLQRLRYSHFLRFMLDAGILDILSEKLNWTLGPKDSIDLNHSCVRTPLTCKKMKHSVYNGLSFEMEQEFDKEYRNNLHSPNNIIFEPKSRKRQRSPSPDYTLSPISSLSPSSSASSSDYEMQLDDDETESNYSSVYSDAEEEPSRTEVEVSSVKKKSEVEENETSKYCVKFYMSTYALNSFSLEIVNLLKLFVNMKPIALELSSSDIIFKLVLFCLPKNESVRPHHLLRIIKAIIKTPEHLLGLLKQTKLIQAAYKFSIPRHNNYCLRCVDLFSIGRMILSNFTKIIEGASGKGDIAHQLYRGNLAIKQKLIVIVPFVIEKDSTFNNLMSKCGGLNILVDLLQENSDYKRICVSSLTTMARKLKIKDPSNNSDFTCDPLNELLIDFDCYKLKQTDSQIVYFKLDDGTHIQSDRDFLSKKSDFFEQLLFGKFKESHEEEIQLRNVQHKPFKLVLFLLQQEVNSKKVVKLNVDLDIILEAISLSDRFLLEDLCVYLTLCVQYFKFSPKTAASIFRWSVESGTNILRVEIVAYALVGPMSESQRYNLFDKLIELGYYDYLSNDIKELLNRFLCIPFIEK